MDLLQTVRKEGSRGGRADFKWEDVKQDQHRENYLGHSVMAPVGRWQKNRDLNWYAKAEDGQTEAEAKASELRTIKHAEAVARAAALGLPPPDEVNANMIPLEESRLEPKAARTRTKDDRRKRRRSRSRERGDRGEAKEFENRQERHERSRERGDTHHRRRPRERRSYSRERSPSQKRTASRERNGDKRQHDRYFGHRGQGEPRSRHHQAGNNPSSSYRYDNDSRHHQEHSRGRR